MIVFYYTSNVFRLDRGKVPVDAHSIEGVSQKRKVFAMQIAIS